MAKFIAIDFGLKRTGIAETDDNNIIASPLETVKTDELFPFLRKYFETNNVEKIILGYPEDIDKNKTIVKTIKKIFIQLQEEFKDKEVILQDERYTSKIAASLVKSSCFKKKKKEDKSILDKISASIILRSFLDKYKK
jgi:putative Holliday junction resolvase